MLQLAIEKEIIFFYFFKKYINLSLLSAHCWQLHRNVFFHLDNLNVKRLSDTRRSAHAEDCSSVNKNCNEIIMALSYIIKSVIEKDVIKSVVRRLHQMKRLKTDVMVVLWNKILERFNVINKKT